VRGASLLCEPAIDRFLLADGPDVLLEGHGRGPGVLIRFESVACAAAAGFGEGEERADVADAE